ncbi:MAG: right-handed parallel beta-helix repeat-containing protein [Flavobacteriales bacterium]|nr:right-handed parallel beta-helix repeat-containing protein [Flavobacteriales bacterium]
MSILRWLLPLSVIISLLISTGCADDLMPGEAALTFSEDTVIFDTVFTTIGSVTRQFKVYNPNSADVTISSVMLAGGQQSKYRINVDGVPGTAFSNVLLRGNDSMFVFVDVTLDPNNLNAPAMVTDSVVFVANGVTQDVDLAACGWDADFYYPTAYLPGLGSYSIVQCTNEVWTSAKPVVIYGYAVVDEDCHLTIEAGTRVFSHKYSGLLVFDGGSLEVRGMAGNEVIFASDRLDPFYVDQAGEWNGIWLFNGSRDNTIDHAIIKNATIGIRVDSFNTASSNPTLVLSNTVIENMSSAGLLAYTSKVNAYNCVFGNGGQVSAALSIGGEYNFHHCTFGNYWSLGNRQTPAVLLSNWQEGPGDVPYLSPLDAYFGNCIIYGNNINELGLDNSPAAAFDFKLDRCLLRVDPVEVDVSNPLQFADIILNENPKFKDAVNHDFELDTLSPAMNAGYQIITNAFPELSTDLLGNFRPFGLSLPDLGAYERQE